MEILTIADTLTRLERRGFIKTPVTDGLLYTLKGSSGDGQIRFTGDMDQCYLVVCDVTFKKEYMNGFYIPEHYIELSTISDSQLSYEQTDGHTTKVLKGTGCYINLGEPGVMCVPADTRLTYTSFVVREKVISDHRPAGDLETDLLEHRNRVLLNSQPPCHRLTRVLCDLVHCRMQGRIKTLYYQTKAIEVLCLLSEMLFDAQGKQTATTVQDRAAVEKARKLLAHKLSVPPTTNELARQVGVSATKLKQIFKQETGQTIFDYLKSIRLGTALSLMTDSGATITSVANDIGYKSPSKFTAAFRQQYGVNPGKYLRMVRQRP